MRIIAFDVGKARTGIAQSDLTGTLASPARVINKAEMSCIVAEAVAFARECGAQRAVVGLPTRTDGGEGDTAAFAREFAAKFAAESGVETVFSDERYSTSVAHRNYNEAGKKGAKNRRATIDAAAAAVILQSYLDFNKG